MIYLLLIKKDLLYYMQDVRGSERNRTGPLRSPSCTKVRLVAEWNKRSSVMGLGGLKARN